MYTEFSHSHHLQCYYYVTINSHLGYNESLLTILSAFFLTPDNLFSRQRESSKTSLKTSSKHHLLSDANPDYPTSAPTLFPNPLLCDSALLFPFLQQL